MSGVLRCGSMCQPVGQVCTANSDCCLGLLCIIPKGSLTGTCGNQNTLPDGGVPPPPPPDGGYPDGFVPPTPDMAVRPQLGQKCTTTTPCCNQLNCTPPGRIRNCAVGGMDCSCTS